MSTRAPSTPRIRQHGQSLIEVALSLGVLLGLAVGFFRVASIVIHTEATDTAAREAAQAGAVQSRLDQACLAAISYGQTRLTEAGLLGGSRILVSTTPANTYQRGGTIQVQVRVQIPVLFGTTFTYATSAEELIQPGRARFPVRGGGSVCTASA